MQTPPSEWQPLAQELFDCAAQAQNSAQKRALLLQLPTIVYQLAQDIAALQYQPKPFTVFAVTDPKLREIFAPAFEDRLVQQWLVRQVQAWWEPRFAHDSYANRPGKGTQAAVRRLQHFMRQTGHRWVLKLDIQAFFPSIDRRILAGLWDQALSRMPLERTHRQRVQHVAHAILRQSPTVPAPQFSGQRALLAQIPRHKSLFGCASGVGLPVGSLSSQFFANVYLHELDQFVKRHLRVRAYIRYVDDFVLLADAPDPLLRHQQAIDTFLQERLHLRLHPSKVVLQRSAQGLDFLGAIVSPHHLLTRQRTVRALYRRIHQFQRVMAGQAAQGQRTELGTLQRWLQDHPVWLTPDQPNPAFLHKMLATLNSYYGLMQHHHTWHLRQHIYHQRLGALRRYFLPANANYTHLRIRTHWLASPGMLL
jgi:RNA-directed DNA polymerase